MFFVGAERKKYLRFWALNRLFFVGCGVGFSGVEFGVGFSGVEFGGWSMSFCLVWCGVLGCYFFIGRFGAGLPFRVFGASFRISISSLWGKFGTSVVVL